MKITFNSVVSKSPKYRADIDGLRAFQIGVLKSGMIKALSWN